MSTAKKKSPSAKKAPKPESPWVETAKAIGTAAMAAALPILIQAAAEALAKNAQKQADKK